MIINNTEALKSWLVIVLAPLCDADSSALARYVLALLKKDKPEDVLKCVMIEQLDVFLGEETTPFVERLFNAISTEEYLTIHQTTSTSTSTSTQPTPTTTTTTTTLSSPAVKIENEFDIDDNLSAEAISLAKGDAIRNASKSDESNMPFDEKLKHSIKDECTTKEVNLNQKVVGGDVSAASNLCKLSNSTSTTVISDGGCVMNTQRHISPLRGHITASDKENQPRESRRRRPSQQSRSRTRSRSLERYTRRSRSPRDRRGNQRQFRNNKSPPSNCHDRRRGAAFNRGERQRSSAANNNASNSNNHVESTRKMRSNNPHGTSSSSPDRSRSTSTAIAASGQEADITKMEKRQRCRDFDEKGYCVRGETCPWDHGINPVVFEGINNPALISMSLREYNPDAPDLWSRSSTAAGLSSTGMVVGSSATSNINPFTGTPRVNPLTGAATAGIVYPTHVGVGVGVGVGAGLPIDKAAGGAAAPLAYRSTGPPLIQYPFNAGSPMQQRELIPIPVVDAEIGNMSSMKAAMGPESNSIGGHPPANKRRFDLMEEHNVNVATDALPPKRKLAVNSRLGPRLPANIQSNCSLELRKVPRGLNTIAHLNNHFAKFGKIVNIQISYEGDPEAAIITFSTHAEANVAYRSTEAVLNNRFIKVFWHTEVAATGETNANAVVNGARKNNHHYHLNNMTANASGNTANTAELTTNKANTSQVSSELNNKDNNTNSGSGSGSGATNATNETVVPATTAAAVTATHVPATSLRLKNNVGRPTASNAGMRKKQEEQVKAVVQLANGLRKRKQELLQSYVKQMKSALELVERCDPQDAQRAKTLETIKILQETIDKLRKEIAAEQEQVQAQMTSNQKTAGNLITKNSTPPAKKSKEQQKKELLDIELELFAQQQEGNDTTAIQKRLEELQRNLGIGYAPAGGAAAAQLSAGSKLGTFSSNPRKNPRAMRTMVFPEGPTRVDRRPKTIVITGFVSDEADFVLGHFKHFGEILKHDVDREIPQLILSYATRMSAEQAVVRGKMFKGNKLQISWAPVISNPTNQNESKPSMDKLAQDIKIEKEELETVGDDNNKLNAGIGDVTELGCTNDKKDLLLSEKLISDNTLLPELRLEDEEEEEESEDRSWRR